VNDLDLYRNNDGTYTSPRNGKTYKSLKAFRSHWFYPGHVSPDTFKKRIPDVECQHCGKVYSKANIRRHEAACPHNPDNIRKCPVCDSKILNNYAVTCSYACSNTYFRHSNKGGLQYKSDDQLKEDNRYRDICARYHEMSCVICGENNLVEVHHLNEDSKDHRPENLVPLCPTHHQYWHSRYRHLVEDVVYKYMEQKFGR
jgi:phage FluMu protein Com